LSLSLLEVALAFTADSDFDGRWDINAGGGPTPRAWWVELNGVGTPNANGKFGSAYHRDMNNIDSIAVENGELTFTIIQPLYGDRPSRTMRYRADAASPANVSQIAGLGK